MPLSSGSLGDLVSLVLELWPECVYGEEYAYFEGIISREDEICFLAIYRNENVGFIHVAIRYDYVEGADSSPVAYVEAIYVRPAHRKMGIAGKLFSVAEQWARLHGCHQIAPDAELENPGIIDFHCKIGFREANRVVCFIKDL